VIYTRQQEAKGSGPCRLVRPPVDRDEPFAVVLVDDLIHSESPACADDRGAGARPAAIWSPSWRSRASTPPATASSSRARDDGRLVEVKSLVEKPEPAKAPSRYAVIGRYMLEPEVFDHLDRHDKGAGGEIQLTDAMAAVDRRPALPRLRFEGERYDCGDKLGYLEAIVAYALARDDLGADFRAMLQRYRLPP
jgi:UTP--glucose-1-phosphate uridylyltransferase